MSKIKLSQYENKFEILYRNQVTKELTNLESIVESLRSNENNYSLFKSRFFYSKPVITLHNNQNRLVGNVKINDYKQLYLSYETLNNSFNKSPSKSLLDFKEFKTYLFNIDIVTGQSIEIIPYIIHYKNSKKIKLTRIKEKNQVIDFKNDDQCRLTFKITGHGDFKINLISIKPKG